MSKGNLVKINKLKARGGGRHSLPSSIIRVYPNSLAVSANVMKRFESHFYDTGKTLRVKLNIDINHDKRLIRLSPDEEGFSFLVSKSKAGSIRLPVAFKEYAMPLGDYKTPNQNNTFKLVV